MGNVHDPRVLQSLTLVFALLFAVVLRYARLFVGIYANLTFKAYPVSANPTFTPKDVTVILPTTFKTPDELVQCLRCINTNAPKEILIVTGNANVDLARALCKVNSFKNTRVMGIKKLCKRDQQLLAIKEVQTDIIVMADDDVFWPAGFLEQLLAIFESPSVGAGGPLQKLRRQENTTFIDFLGTSYLSRRVFNNLTTNAIDGSISTLSGRSAAYRTSILKTENFYYAWNNDTFLGHPITVDDDKRLTRFVYSSGYEIAIQRGTCLETSLERSPGKFLSQATRWARGHWRGNFMVMTNETYWRSSKYAWGTYVIYLGMFQTPSLIVDASIISLLWMTLSELVSPTTRSLVMMAFGIVLFFSKIVKLIPHFMDYPGDMVYIPLSVLFSYAHGFINIYALCTMLTTVWGNHDLKKLEEVKATGDEIVPLLKTTQAKATYHVPTPGKIMVGDDVSTTSPPC